MKIAVTYENGQVFGHFGHTEQFKIYEEKDGEIVSSEVISAEGNGHSELAGFLKGIGTDVLICGGIGAGAQEALEESGIVICSGAEGDADIAVKSYLEGKLERGEANCDHHGCGHSCGGGCHCGPDFEGPNVGKTLKTHYRGTFNDGTQFDSSYDRGEPLEFVCGAGMMIKGFDRAVADMKIGEIKEIHLEPSEAYGEIDPSMIFTVPISSMPGAENLDAGMRVYLQNSYGQPFPVTVTEISEETITFDANSEMAGKELNFTIELVDIK